MMTPEKYVKYMVDTYGVRSCYEDADEVAREDLWFECPECGEPICSQITPHFLLIISRNVPFVRRRFEYEVKRNN